MNKLPKLFLANKGRGAPLAMSRDGSEVTVELYDTLVSSEVDVDWLGGVSAERFVQIMRSVSATDTVHVRINSPGGDYFAGVAMAQAIRECKAKVIAHVDGYAASAASNVLIAAPESVIAPGAMVMIHKAWMIEQGNSDDFMASAALLEKVDGLQAAQLTARAGGDEETWLAALAAETWYSGPEAVTAGLVTRLATDDAPVGAKALSRLFDLSAYDNAPARAAEAEEEAPAIAAKAEETNEAEDNDNDNDTPEIERRRRLALALALNPA